MFSAYSKPSELIENADLGNPEAMYWLGYCYLYGTNGFEENEILSEKWLKESSNRGYQPASELVAKWFNNKDDKNGFDESYESSESLSCLFKQYDNLVIVDLETSGLDPTINQIIELSAIKVTKCSKGNRISEEIDELIALPEGQRLPFQITTLTGISEEVLKRAGKNIDMVFNRLLSLIGSDKTLLVAYNAQFDMRFLEMLFNKKGYGDLFDQLHSLDALTIYKDRRPYPHKLENAIEAYRLTDKVANTHHAMDDVYSLYEVIKAMDAEESDLDKYIDLYGYNPKYGISGGQLPLVKYIPQPYESNYKLYEMI